MTQPTTSVIVPVYNGAETLAACLAALQQQTQPPQEIIVVDDGSTDGTAAVAAEFGVSLLRQANAGPAAARNRGAQAASGEILLFTDADCVPAPDWAARMVVPFQDPDVVGAKGEYRTQQPGLVARFVQQEYQERYGRMAGQDQIDFIDTYAAAYRRQAFLASGGFDSSFPTASVEDQELSFRLAARGCRLVYVPGAVVYHRHDRSIGEYAHRKYWIGYWKAWITRRYPAKLAHDSHTPPSLKLQLGLAGLGAGGLGVGLLGRQRRPVLAGLLAWLLLLLSGAGLYRQIWQRDPAVLPVAPLLVWVRAWALGWGYLRGNLHLMGERFKGNSPF